MATFDQLSFLYMFDIMGSHGDIYQLTSGNYSVLSIAKASKHSQIGKA